jgi:hypothetical protein
VLGVISVEPAEWSGGGYMCARAFLGSVHWRFAVRCRRGYAVKEAVLLEPPGLGKLPQLSKHTHTHMHTHTHAHAQTTHTLTSEEDDDQGKTGAKVLKIVYSSRGPTLPPCYCPV